MSLYYRCPLCHVKAVALWARSCPWCGNVRDGDMGWVHHRTLSSKDLRQLFSEAKDVDTADTFLLSLSERHAAQGRS